MRALKYVLSVFVLTLISAISTPAAADAVSDFFQGKTLTLVIGYTPGGGYDT